MKLILFITIICINVVVADVFVDSLNRADETPIGGNYTSLTTGKLNLTNNKLFPATGGDHCVIRRNGTFSNDQHMSGMLVVGNGTTVSCMMGVRMDNDSVNGYLAGRFTGDQFRIYKATNGSLVELAAVYKPSWSASDRTTTGCSGDSIYGIVNADTLLRTHDDTYASGNPAVYFSWALDDSLDNLEGGDNSSCASPTITNPSNISDTVGDTSFILLTTTGADIDSIHIICGIDSMWVSPTFDTLWFINRNKLTGVACSLSIYGCASATAADSATFTYTAYWVPIRGDSITVGGIKTTTLYYGDTTTVWWWCRNFESFDDADPPTFGDSALDPIDSSTTYFKFILKNGIAIRNYIFVIEDSVSSDTLKTGGVIDSFYVAGLYDTATITLNPHDTTVSNGQTVIFHISATSTGTITYKWQVDDGGGYDDVAASNNDTLTWAAATAENGYLYRCIATDPRGADTSAAATLTVSAINYTLTITDDGNGSTVPSGANNVAQGAGTAIAATADAHYHFIDWTVTVGSGATFADANDATTACTLLTGNATVLANFGIDSFTVTVVDGDNVNLTILNGASKGWGTVCSIGVDVDAGYAYAINGGAITLADDTLLITVGGDSTVTGVSYRIPVIDSIRDSTALRDSANPQAGRPLDTMIAYGIGFSTIGDSTQMNLNSTGSVKGTILSAADSKLVFVIPTGTPRGWYSSWVRTKDMVSGTPLRHALLIKRPGGL